MATEADHIKSAKTESKELSFRFWRKEDGLHQEILFLCLVFMSAYYYLALASFSPLDPSAFNYSYPPQLSRNQAGILGAEIAAYLIYYFGLLAFLFPLPFLILSLRQVLGTAPSWTRAHALALFCFGLGLSLLVQILAIPLSWEGYSYQPSGQFGLIFTASLTKIFGQSGIILLCLAGLSLPLLLLNARRVVKPCLHKLAFLSVRQLWPWKTRLPSANPSRVVPQTKAELIPAEVAITSDRIVWPNPSQTGEAKAEPEVEAIRTSSEPQLFARETSHARESEQAEQSFDPNGRKKAEPNDYQPPPHELFRTSPYLADFDEEKKKEYELTAEALVKAFSEFGIGGEIIAIQPGPVVTVYEFQPIAGTKLAKLTGLLDDIALALKVDSIFMHPVSGKRALGVQVPNRRRETVTLGDLIQDPSYQKSQSPLTFALGKAINGEPICCDLAAMPHLLTAGQTGAGKSVTINALLCSIIMKARPEDVRLILVDPKILELKIYEGIPHLLMPVITDALKASLALKWACQEMDRRYALMENAKVRHISGFNQYWDHLSTEEKQKLEQQFPDREIGKLPFIVIVIDELADLMLTASKDVESSIQRLAQKARASGIHLVLATQRPSVDVITGVIKANLPCRIAFKVFSRTDSRTILDSMGAERLLGKGDLLFLRPGSSRLERIQGAFLADDEVIKMVEHLKQSTQLTYDAEVMEWIDSEFQRQNQSGTEQTESPGNQDPKYEEALQIAQRQGSISASYLQRMLKIGYNRAARIVESMEAQGLVAKADGVKPRAWTGPSY